MSAVTVTLTFPTYEDTIIALSKLRTETPKAEAAKPAPDRKPEAPKAETKPEPESTTIVYETDVAPKIAAAVKTNRADVIAVLGRFGAKTGKDLKPADYASFLEDLQTRIEASANLA